jgi:hypothetical protein
MVRAEGVMSQRSFDSVVLEWNGMECFCRESDLEKDGYEVVMFSVDRMV